MNAKSAKQFVCDICNFKCSKQSNYDRHLITSKHLFKENLNDFEPKTCQQTNYACEICGKGFKGRNGLWYHKTKCKLKNNEDYNEDCEISSKELILFLVKQNKELMDIVKNSTQITNNTINNNSHNKTFNLQFFLNETCKDAMNIKDFVENVELELSDLENVGKSGYIEGISNIIIKNLKALDVQKRPIHCTDKKRETFYIKDKDVWEKEEENKPKLRQLIKAISHKNISMFKKFREKYPDCDEGDSKKCDIFNKIVYESMGGKGDDDIPKQDKIIQKITKHITIDKDNLL